MRIGSIHVTEVREDDEDFQNSGNIMPENPEKKDPKPFDVRQYNEIFAGCR